jgi:hypothetical protein
VGVGVVVSVGVGVCIVVGVVVSVGVDLFINILDKFTYFKLLCVCTRRASVG